MEYKDLPFRKRKIDAFFLEELGISSTPHNQLKTRCEEASIQTDVTSLVIDDVGEQGRYLTIERGASKINGNLHPESVQRSRRSSGDYNSYSPETAPVKKAQGSHDTDGASGGMTKSLKASAACSTDTEVFCNPHRVLMEDADEDVDKFDCPSMTSDNAAPIATERIWEGSIQFYPNATLPILALFKSGQKLLDINWSSLLIIKGKLPLEDFEKYIKALPRSRTRKLMVISLCWKIGSSVAAIKFSKEVVKRYETTKQVAYAQPSPDVRLYLYPWDEVITTTLVKCGYLEEKVSIADKSELLIGCVVWRRNQITSSSLLNQSELKGTYSLMERDLKPPTGENQTIRDALLELPENRGVEPLREQGFKSSIKKDQENSSSLLEESKNRGARLLKEREIRLLKLPENKGVEPLKEQGSKSSIERGQNSSGSLLEQSKNCGARLLKEREIRLLKLPDNKGAEPLKEQGSKSSIERGQNSSGSLLEQSKNGGARLLKEREIRLLKLPENKGAEPLKEQGFKSSIERGQNSSGSLLEQSKNGGARPLKKREIRGGRPLKEQEVWSPVRADQTSSGAVSKKHTGGVEPLKEQGFKSSIGKGQNKTGSLLERFKNQGALPLKKREIRGGGLSKEQEVWSPVRADQTSSSAVLKQRTGDFIHPWKEQGLKFQNDRLEPGCSNIPAKNFKVRQLKTAPTSAISSKAKYSSSCSGLQRTITLKPFCNVEETAVGDLGSSADKISVCRSLKTSSSDLVLPAPPAVGDLGSSLDKISVRRSLKTSSSDLVLPAPPAFISGKFISKRYGNKNPFVGNGNDLHGLISSILEPSAVGKIEPSLPLHSKSFKTTSLNLPVDSPRHLTPSNEPEQVLGKILPPVPDPHKSLARHFTFSPNPRPSSGLLDAPIIIKKRKF